ncbi:MAG: nucleotidyltransferase domain-containing protein, partial [Chloroflexi bacterium]|nr:nucleotidyltransferase domain-containing protein [Chloroflexota bacterium]
AVVRKIVENFDPEKVILFGSYAYGKPTIDSDVDVLVVMESNETPAARATRVIGALRGKTFPMDILVSTPAEIEHRLAIGDFFYQEIVGMGKVLYERRTA